MWAMIERFLIRPSFFSPIVCGPALSVRLDYLRKIDDAGKNREYPSEHAQPVLAEGEVLVHDEHLVEEVVHEGFESREHGVHVAVVLFRDGRKYPALHALEVA